MTRTLRHDEPSIGRADPPISCGMLASAQTCCHSRSRINALSWRAKRTISQAVAVHRAWLSNRTPSQRLTETNYVRFFAQLRMTDNENGSPRRMEIGSPRQIFHRKSQSTSFIWHARAFSSRGRCAQLMLPINATNLRGRPRPNVKPMRGVRGTSFGWTMQQVMPALIAFDSNLAPIENFFAHHTNAFVIQRFPFPQVIGFANDIQALFERELLLHLLVTSQIKADRFSRAYQSSRATINREISYEWLDKIKTYQSLLRFYGAKET
jgi:hypothetical protein